MSNLAMRERFKRGECIDIRGLASPYTGTDEFLQNTFEFFFASELPENVDFCDMQNEKGVRSIGKQHSTGKIFAALDSRFYDTSGYTCIWLR